MDFEKSILILIDVLVAAVILGGVTWAYNFIRDWRDRRTIYLLLRGSVNSFRSTHAIASNTGIAASRVTKLCESDKRIRRNELEYESWTLR